MADTVNPYDQVYSDLYNNAGAREARLRDSMIKAQEVHPDEAAKAAPMSEETGLPIDMVVRNLPEMQKSFNTDHLDYQKMLTDYPKLSNFLTQPENSAVSHDDVPALQRVSSFFSSTNNFIEQAIPRAIKSTISGAAEGIGGTLTGLGAVASNAGDSMIDSLVNTKPQRQWTAQGWVDTAPAGSATTAVGQTLAGALSTAGEGMAWLGKQYTDIAPQIAPDDMGIGNKVAQTLGQFLPWVFATAATGGESALPYLFGGSAVGASQEQAKAEGKYGTPKANLAIALNGAINAALGSKTVSGITHALPDNVLLKMVEGINKMGVPVGSSAERWITKAMEGVYRAVTGGGQMAAITATHNATDKFLMDHPEKDAPEGVGEQFGLAGAASALLGFMFQAVAKAPTMFDSARANAQKEYFKHSKEVLADNKLLKRSPEKLNALIDSQTGGHDVHVNPSALQEFYQAITPEERARLDSQMPDLAKDIADGNISKADIPVNQADFHTYIQPLDRAGQLDDWIKLIPEHMSLGDVKAHEEFMQSLFDHVDEENRARAMSTDATNTQNSVYDQLIRFTGVGRTPSAMVDVAKLISENPAKFHEAMMARTGNRADVAEVLNRLIRDVQIKRVLPEMDMRKGDIDLQLDDLRNVAKETEKKAAKPSMKRDKNGKLKYRKGRNTSRAATPILDYLGSLGGVRRGSVLAKELEALGIDKNSHPQAFNKFTAPDENQGSMLGKVMHDQSKYGLKGLDTLVPSEFEDSTGVFPTREPVSGLIDQEWLMDQLRNEAHAEAEMSDKDQSRESLSQMLEYLGLDVNKHSNVEIKRAIEAAQKDQNSAMDQGGETFYQSKSGGFYSAVENAVGAIKQDKGTGEQFLAQIKNTPGVKAEEMEWLGLDDFLKGKKNVTKQEVQDYIASHKVQVHEVTLGGGHSDDESGMEEDANGTYTVYDPNGDVMEKGLSLEEAEIALNDMDRDTNSDGTKFSEYTLPGGENYREVLLTLPPKGEAISYKATITRGVGGSNIIDDILSDMAAEGMEHLDYGADDQRTQIDIEKFNEGDMQKLRDILSRYPDARMNAKDITKTGKEETFNSSHFSQSNILAHLRLNDRTDADGKKVLFIEEIQSDWHQKGRKQGYGERYSVGVREDENVWVVTREDGKFGDVSKADAKTADEAQKYANNHPDIFKYSATKKGVPDAPLKKTWQEMAFRRAAQMAAEGGYDRIAWTTGEQQNDRFDLSKKVDSLLVKKNGDGTYKVSAQIQGRGQMMGEAIPEGSLEDHVGKEVAKKIIEGGGKDINLGANNDPIDLWKEFSGVDLKVGGEGMKGFYDKIIPDYAKKFGKKFGAKVGETVFKGLNLDSQHYGPETKTWGMDITPEMRESVERGITLFQGDNRGSITYTPDGGAVIRTFAQEDLSTVLHEFGHLYWKAMTEIGNLADAPASVVRDIKTMRDWVGAKEGETLSVEQEEKIADGFLDYLRKGEAPSADMQGAFSRFKGWLVRLYTGVRDTLPKISPEVKDVFDRMFATDAEIEALKAMPEFQPDPAIMAMLTKAEREKYQAKMEKQIADAKDRLFREAMRQSEREQTQLYKDQRAEIEKIATEQVSNERGYRTIHEAIKAGGLSKKMLIKEFGKEIIPYLSGHGGIVKTDGVDPAMVAMMMGYNNSREMIDELMNLKPKKKAIQELTDDEMITRHGDMLRDGTIEGEALKAYHNNLKAEMIHMEMETAAKAAGIPAPSKEAIKARAIKMLSDMKVKDIIPYRHYQAELKAAREAGLNAGKKDYVGTARAKGQQLLNHYLYRMSLTAREDIDQQMTQWRKILGRSDKKIGKGMDTDYVHAARFILARHGLGKQSYNFDAWLNALKFESSPDNPHGDPEAYFAIRDIIDQERASDPTPYKVMPLTDFYALGDTVNSLIMTGRDRSKFTKDGQKIELKDVLTKIMDALANRKPSGISTGFSGKLTSVDRARLFIMSANANWRRVEHWVQMVDGGNNGPVREYLWSPVKKAVLQYRDERAPWMTRIMETLEPERERLHGEKIPAPELQNEKTGETYTFSDLSELMGMMLHLGNESNRFKLLKGRGWSEEGMDAFMNRMYAEKIVTKHDLDLRQKLWDMMEELKPRLWAAHKEMYGYRPDEVTASPITTPHGEYRGGYWPAIVDTEVSEDAQIRADQNAIANTGQSYAFPSAGRGALKSRVENYAGPLQMSMRLLPNHIDWALKFINIEPAIKDAAKIVMNRDFRDMLRTIDPQATTDMLVPWLQRTAKQITEIPSTGRFFKSVAGVARWARTSAGIQALGGNFANMGIHLTQLAPFARELGANRMAEAMAAYIKNPGDIAEAQNELSPELRNRQQIGAINPMTEIGRILRDQSEYDLKRKIDKNAVVRKVKSVKDWSHDNAYILQAIVWHMTDHIGWHAAYNKALEGEVRGVDANDSAKAVEYADSLVRRIQGSHNPEDISNIEMRSAWAKIFQFMYGWFNNMGNYTATEKDIIKNSNKTPAAKAASSFYLHLMTMVAVGFGAEVISGSVRGATPSQNDKYKREGSVALHWLEELGVSMVRWEGAKVPYLNAVVNGLISQYTDKQYSDHLAPSPLFDQVDTILRTPGELWKAMHGQGTNATAIGDLLSTLGFVTSTPISALKKPVKYLMRVDENKEHPKNGLEFARGILGGPAPKK